MIALIILTIILIAKASGAAFYVAAYMYMYLRPLGGKKSRNNTSIECTEKTPPKLNGKDCIVYVASKQY